MRHGLGVLPRIEAPGFDVSGILPMDRDRALRVIAFDGVAVRA